MRKAPVELLDQGRTVDLPPAAHRAALQAGATAAVARELPETTRARQVGKAVKTTHHAARPVLQARQQSLPRTPQPARRQLAHPAPVIVKTVIDSLATLGVQLPLFEAGTRHRSVSEATSPSKVAHQEAASNYPIRRANNR